MVHLDNVNIVWQSEPVCLGEPVRTHIQFKFLFIETFTILPSQVKERSDFGTIWK